MTKLTVNVPMDHGISFHQAAALLSDCRQGRCQSDAGYTFPAVLLARDEAGYSPESVVASRLSRTPTGLAPVDTQKLLRASILAPTHWLAIGINKNAVGTFLVNEPALIVAVRHA
jgi:hypothetical protein